MSVQKVPQTNVSEPVPDEFKNKRVPLDGIELLLNRDKVPDDLGKRLDEKGAGFDKSAGADNDNGLSDLDDIISDAESVKERKFSSVRPEDRAQRRLNFMPKKFKKPERGERGERIRPDRAVPDRALPDRASPERVDRFQPEHVERVERPLEREKSFQHFERPATPPRPPSKPTTPRQSQPTMRPPTPVEERVSDEEFNSEEFSDVSVREPPITEPMFRPINEMTKEEIASEKMTLLYRYRRLVENGYRSGVELSMKSPLETLRTEVGYLEKTRAVASSIRNQRKILVSVASGLEYVNKRYSPYKLHLDGFSESVLDNIGDYDETLELLYEKYKDSVQMLPEIKLLALFGSAAVMHHLTGTLFKSATPDIADILRTNPDLMRQMQQATLNKMSANASQADDPIMASMLSGVANQRAPQASNSYDNTQTTQRSMAPPDDVLASMSRQNMASTALISDTEEPTDRQINTKKPRKSPKPRKGQTTVIDLDM